MMWVGPIQPAEVLNRRTDLPWARVNFASRWFSDLNWLLNWLFLVLQLAGPSCSFWTCLPPWYSRIVWADSLNLSVCIFASLVAQMVTNLPVNAGDVSSIPGLGRFPGEGSGYPLQYSCLGNPMDRGAWWGTVHGVTKESDTTLQLSNNSNLPPYSKPTWVC